MNTIANVITETAADTDTITIILRLPGPRLASRGATLSSNGICRSTPTIRRTGWR